MRWFCTPSAVILSACTFMALVGTASAPAQSTTAELTNARILEISLAEASRAGDSKPTKILMARGTTGVAYDVVEPGSTRPGPPDPEPVVAVAMRGRFSPGNWPSPPCKRRHCSVHRSRVLDLLIRSTAGSPGGAFSFDFAERMPNLSRIGPVTRLR